VAPVAGGIANRKKYRFIFGFGFYKRFLTPGIPVDGVVFVLQQVGRFFGCEMVHGYFFIQ
jgi:hypothetical protein